MLVWAPARAAVLLFVLTLSTWLGGCRPLTGAQVGSELMVDAASCVHDALVMAAGFGFEFEEESHDEGDSDLEFETIQIALDDDVSTPTFDQARIPTHPTIRELSRGCNASAIRGSRGHGDPVPRPPQS